MATRELLSTIDPWLAPYSVQLQQRVDYVAHLKRRFLKDVPLTEFALGHLYFGLHKTSDEWIFREWAPNATRLFLVGESTHWQDDPRYECKRIANGQWELRLPLDALAHGTLYKLHMYWSDGDDFRIPSYATYVVQDAKTHTFSVSVWDPEDTYQWQHDSFIANTAPLLIYEAHIGMSSSDEKVASYAEFTRDVLPRIKQDGYNTLQLMAIQEHPYYGSFGYHVSNFFAASSRFGTPHDLKQLIDTAHSLGIAVILDVVHSHAVKNEQEGLSKFDGTRSQYFHDGPRGDHEHWDSRVFDYGKSEVAHFLLSNCRYWLDEYHFDGFRFDGVTSMLYTHHGMNHSFTQYDDYFKDVDDDALAYLTLANELIHTINPNAITIAEDMSGMPGLAGALGDGGIGFDYRLNMGLPDLWIKYIKEKRDEDWSMSELFHSLTSHRPEEQTINYAESHDQALVGDKTIMFRLADKDIYDHMTIDDTSLVIDRAVTLHMMIRLLTASTHSGGYLNFMGNEFGHPEWIDFPREGNDWSYAYARRQWQLANDPQLKYKWLSDFDQAMTSLLASMTDPIDHSTIHDEDHIISFMRGNVVCIYNFHPTRSYADYPLAAKKGDYTIVLSSDDESFGGQNRHDTTLTYPSDGTMRFYLPARTAAILKIKES